MASDTSDIPEAVPDDQLLPLGPIPAQGVPALLAVQRTDAQTVLAGRSEVGRHPVLERLVLRFSAPDHGASRQHKREG